MKSLFWILVLNFVALLQYSALLGLLQTHGVAGEGTDEKGNSTCPMTEFTCGNGDCIILSWKCDTHTDCPDGSDEVNCPDRTCSEDEFRCRTGDCIPLRWSCDEDNSDCPDGSDEDRNVCSSRTCGPNHFACDSGLCIPAAWRCDETSDCSEVNGEDERNCTTQETCKGNEFKCANDRCISDRWVCDNDNDCLDNSDEKDCGTPSPECEPNQFRCDDGTCINEDWHCDGEFDCNNHTDEKDCNTNVTNCLEFQFECKTSKTCIHQSWFCDGDPDCPDESDEDCEVTCKPGHFLCTEGKYCLAESLRCDGFEDCQDASDEHNCTTTSVCREGEFSCGEDNPTKCIDWKLVCDGTDDCGNEADEDQSLHCEDNPCDSYNGGCDHICINKFRGQHECSCRPGYKLGKDSDTKCVDINECENNEIRGTCSQRCINKEGSYKCDCFENYSIERKRYCKADGGNPLLLLANKKDLRTIHLETFQYKLLLENDNVHEAIAMDFHFKDKKYYWTDVKTEQILRADFNNVSSVEVIVNKDIHTPDGLAVDWINNNMYWTDTGVKKIEVASLDGSMRKVLVNTGLGEPRAIVVDPNSGYIYWTDWGSEAKIERCTMNGENRQTIVSTEIRWPNGLTIDYEGKRLYWMDAHLHKIESSNMDGSNRVTILTSHLHLKRPFAITVFEDFLYWTDGPTESVWKVSKFIHGKVERIALNLHSPMDIHVLHPYRQHITDAGRKFCGDNRQSCSHFCFPNPMVAANYSCACPDGFTLNGDDHTCSEGGTATDHASSTVQPTLPDSDNRSRNNGSDASISVATEGSTPFVEISTEGQGGYTVVNPTNHTTVNTPQHKDEEHIGKIAGVVVAVLSVLIIIAAAVCVILYKRYSRNHGKSMNFDNPVYRKTTTDELIIEKNGVNTNLPDSRQPLTQPNNEIV